MTTVTLTTDYGLTDHYAAVLKGSLLRSCNDITVVDITHNIRNFDIVQAAFIFQNAWTSFPEGTVHLITVNDLSHQAIPYLIVPHAGHFFIGPDNGFFTLIFQTTDLDAFRLPGPESGHYAHSEVFGQVITRLQQGVPIEEIGVRQESLVQRLTFQPVTSADQIRGAVIYIDNYHNVITNIRKTLFDQIGLGRPFALYFKGHDPIRSLCRFYSDAPIGEPLCRVNASGFLEIAINLGKAATLLGLEPEDTVQIDFETPNASNE